MMESRAGTPGTRLRVARGLIVSSPHPRGLFQKRATEDNLALRFGGVAPAVLALLFVMAWPTKNESRVFRAQAFRARIVTAHPFFGRCSDYHHAPIELSRPRIGAGASFHHVNSARGGRGAGGGGATCTGATCCGGGT